MYTLCFCSKLVKYDVVVVELLINSWSIGVVVVVMRCCCCGFMLCCCWRAWRDVQKQQTPFLLFRVFRARSELSKMLLPMCLAAVFTLSPTGTPYKLDWVWFYEIELNLLKISKNVDFSEKSISQGKRGGLGLPSVVFIWKNVLDGNHGL